MALLITAFLVFVLISLIFMAKKSFSLRKFYEDFIDYIHLVFADFDTYDKLVTRDIVKFNVLHLKIAIVNDPQLIMKVFNSDLCMDKPGLFYGMLHIDHGLISAKSKLLLRECKAQT